MRISDWSSDVCSSDLARAGDTRGELRRLSFVALPEPAHGIAIAVVPLRPACGEVADLIAAHADVPGLGDQLDPRQRRVLKPGVEETRTAVEGPVRFAGQRRS